MTCPLHLDAADSGKLVTEKCRIVGCPVHDPSPPVADPDLRSRLEAATVRVLCDTYKLWANWHSDPDGIKDAIVAELERRCAPPDAVRAEAVFGEWWKDFCSQTISCRDLTEFAARSAWKAALDFVAQPKPVDIDLAAKAAWDVAVKTLNQTGPDSVGNLES